MGVTDREELSVKTTVTILGITDWILSSYERARLQAPPVPDAGSRVIIPNPSAGLRCGR